MNINRIINVRAEFLQGVKNRTLYKVAYKYETSSFNTNFYSLFPYSWLHDGFNVSLRDARLKERTKYKSSLHKHSKTFLNEVLEYLNPKFDYSIESVSRHKGNIRLIFCDGRKILVLDDILENVRTIQDFKDSYLDYIDIYPDTECMLWLRDNEVYESEFLY